MFLDHHSEHSRQQAQGLQPIKHFHSPPAGYRCGGILVSLCCDYIRNALDQTRIDTVRPQLAQCFFTIEIRLEVGHVDAKRYPRDRQFDVSLLDPIIGEMF